MIFEIIDFYHRKKKTFISIIFIVLITIVIILSFCFKKNCYPQELVDIDSVCSIRPDRASEMLKAYNDKNQGMKGETKWYYRFLILKSTIKANKKISSVNETKSLIGHYEKGGDKKLLPEVYYCAGCALNSLMDILQANNYFYKGIKSLEGSNNQELLALCCYQLGRNLSLQGFHKEALSWEKRSLALNRKMKDTTRCIYDNLIIAWTLGNLGKPREALRVMCKTKDMAIAAGKENDLSEIECQITNHCLELGLLQEAKRHIDNAIEIKRTNKSELYSIALETYARLGDEEKTREYIDSVMRHGNVYAKKFAYWCLMERSIKNNDMGNISEYMKCYKNYSDSAKKIMSADASAKAHALYNYNIREKENMLLHKKNTNKNFILITISAILIICILSFYIVYIKVKQQKKSIEKRCKILNEQLNMVRETSPLSIQTKENEIKAIKKKLEGNSPVMSEIKETLNAKQTELDDINSRKIQMENCNEKMRETEVYKEINDILKGYSNAVFTKWDVLEEAVYNSFPNFETNLRKLGKLNFMEIKVCLLIRMGLNVKEISIIACTSKSNIYSINQRLYYKKFGKYAASSDWIKFIKAIY